MYRRITIANQYITSIIKGLLKHTQFSKVETYIMFIGYPRSGHSLIGAILDAHPEMVISHEQNSLKYFKIGFSKDQVFSLILDNSKQSAKNGRVWTGYTYSIPNQYQGYYETLKVIGDKKGGESSFLLKQNPNLIDLIKQKVKIPIKLIHVYRNPFDNITTWAKGGSYNNKEITSSEIEIASAKYFATAELVKCLKTRKNIEIIDIKHEDFVNNTKTELNELIHKIGLEASEEYLSACSSIVFDKPKITRNNAAWTDNLIMLTMQRMSLYSWLKDYTIDR
ncbi:MAG: sulfotransferase [Bacteroidales bacterium]|nr:sulfotransferase [Bacteroidales bacterium]